MIEVLDFLRPFLSEDCWDTGFILAKDDAVDTMGRSITLHADVVWPASNKLGALSQDYAGGRQLQQ
jgi:hypothetical protein